MMTINFDTITNNYEVIYVIKTVMKYYLKKIDTRFHQRLPNMVQRLFADVITWRDLVYEYSWAKPPMISGYDDIDPYILLTIHLWTEKGVVVAVIVW